VGQKLSLVTLASPSGRPRKASSRNFDSRSTGNIPLAASQSNGQGVRMPGLGRNLGNPAAMKRTYGQAMEFIALRLLSRSPSDESPAAQELACTRHNICKCCRHM
jgi:hypothetical protein